MFSPLRKLLISELYPLLVYNRLTTNLNNQVSKMSHAIKLESASHCEADVDSEPPAKKICNSSSSGPSSSSNKNNLSKHSKKKDTKRKDFNLLNMHSRLKQQADQYALDETEYYFEDGFRKVHPYFFTYHTFCKGRWLGKTLRDLYSKEFRFYSVEHYEAARKKGNLLLNLKPVESLDIVLKSNDLMSSRLHRHEGPVIASEIKIIHDDSRYLVVDKPSSIPIHPCGRYRNNTLCYILKREFGYENLLGCHRLDRLTSGIVIFAKTKFYAHKIISEIEKREVEKEYVCRVVGEFPLSKDEEKVVCNQPVTVFDRKLGICAAWKVDGFDAKESCTYFERISTDGKTSIVRCMPKTGRTHQIRVHLQYLGYPIINDPMYNCDVWGEERFKHGPCTKDVALVAQELSRIHQSNPYNQEKPLETSDNNNEVKVCDDTKPPDSEIASSNLTESASKNSHFSPDCLECLNPIPDPEMKWMTMCLHACRYKGSDWEFKADMPDWATCSEATTSS